MWFEMLQRFIHSVKVGRCVLENLRIYHAHKRKKESLKKKYILRRSPSRIFLDMPDLIQFDFTSNSQFSRQLTPRVGSQSTPQILA